MSESRRDEIQEAIAAAVEVLNQWMAEELLLPDLQIYLVTRSSIHETVARFEAQAIRRMVHWDWQEIFFRKVRLKPAWMFELVQQGQPGALCFGQVNIKQDYASIEFLERLPGAEEVKGFVARIAFQFAATVAGVLNLPEVRLMSPHPDLVDYYVSTLDLQRQPPQGEVEYLTRRLKP